MAVRLSTLRAGQAPFTPRKIPGTDKKIYKKIIC
jgi:hypothetical protein